MNKFAGDEGKACVDFALKLIAQLTHNKNGISVCLINELRRNTLVEEPSFFFLAFQA